tara:strand:- start:122458 stop:123216 length:759 start_codon:yes stop_codon:yes gene_type:complete
MKLRHNTTKISDTIAAELEQRILEGSWKVGSKIPPERTLSAELGVSRASLREAVQKLVSAKLLSNQQGGGTFVTNQLAASFSDPWGGILQNHPSVRDDLLEFRELIEAKAAEWAAQRATSEDKIRLQQCFEAFEQAYDDGTVEELADTDLNFHQAIAEASHNVIIGHMTANLLRTLHDNLRLNISELIIFPEARQCLLEQHKAILTAILNGDVLAARRNTTAHVDYVRKTLEEAVKHKQRQLSAERRLNIKE